MNRTLTAALLLGCLTTSPASIGSSLDKEAASQALPYASPAVSGTPSDLDLDTSFSDGGATARWPDLAGGLNEWGLRIQRVSVTMPGPVVLQRIYTLGSHANLASGASVETRDALVLSTDLSGGASTWTVVPTNMLRIDDAVYDPGTRRAYFLGSGKILTDTDMQVRCVDMSTTDHVCAGWPSQSLRWIVFDRGGSRNDVGLRLALDPDGLALYVAGYADSDNGYLLAHAKVLTSTGTMDANYGSSGTVAEDLSGRATGRDHIANSIALSPAAAPGGTWLYLGGTYKTVAGDYDGFLMAVSPATGIGNHTSIAVETDNTGSKTDSVTAISVLANGHVAVAGISDTNDANFPALLLGRYEHHYSANLGAHFLYPDADFCDGGTCAKNLAPPPPPVGNPYGGTRHVLPYAITEWPGNRDLVVAMSGAQNDGTDLSPQPWITYQIVQQFSASAITEHAYRRIGYLASSDDERYAVPGQGMSIHSDDLGFFLLMTGTRRWDATDVDITLAKLRANDSIFADQFGGAHGD